MPLEETEKGTSLVLGSNVPHAAMSHQQIKYVEEKAKATPRIEPHRVRFTEDISISLVSTSNLLELFARAVLIRYAAFYFYFRGPVLGG